MTTVAHAISADQLLTSPGDHSASATGRREASKLNLSIGAPARWCDRGGGHGCRTRARPNVGAVPVALQNVMATPYICGLTQPAIEAQALDTVEQVRALVLGQAPHGAVNAEHWSRSL